MGAAFLVLSLLQDNIALADFGGLGFPGVILLAIGISLFIAYFSGKKMLAKEIEAEEKALLGKPSEEKKA